MQTPNSLRTFIGIFGRTNVGKSTILNLLSGQNAAITSSFAETTTDPVKKAVEFENLGAVTLIDTAGFCDTDALGKKREQKTLKALNEINFALIVVKNGI